MKNYLIIFLVLFSSSVFGQILSEKQMQNARATGFAIVAAKNPGSDFSIYMIPWDGVNTLEYNANHQINSGWHAQAAVKGNYFYQDFDGNDFTKYSSVVLSEASFNSYKNRGTQWWIVCSTLSPFSDTRKNMNQLNVSGEAILHANVGIGTTSPAYKLDVNGTIRATEIKVEAQTADFVFEEDYELKSLEEVEQFIQTNNHLPDIPSAKEMKEDGVGLAEMNKLLLQKVEELTLYVIQLKKEIKKTQK
ncbi:hypothetical protein [Labilibaculum euxinus]